MTRSDRALPEGTQLSRLVLLPIQPHFQKNGLARIHFIIDVILGLEPICANPSIVMSPHNKSGHVGSRTR